MTQTRPRIWGKVPFPRNDPDLIEELLAEAAKGAPKDRLHNDPCTWCDDAWHGMACNICSACGYTVNSQSRLRCRHDGIQCRCDNSGRRLDDTWRPILNLNLYSAQQAKIMHETGVDGWAARAACTGPTPGKIRRYLYAR